MATRVSGRRTHIVTDIVVFVSAAYFAYVGAFIYYFHQPYSTNPGGQRYCLGPHFVTAQVCNDWQSVGSHTRLLFTICFFIAFVALALLARKFVVLFLAVPIATIQFVNADRNVWLVSLGVAVSIPALVLLMTTLSRHMNYRRLRWLPIIALVATTAVAGVLSALNAGPPVPPLRTQSALTTWPSVALSSVSCSTPGVCQAVGSQNDGPDVVLTLHDGRWSTRTLPNSSSDFNPSISCSQPGDCLVTGLSSLFVEHDGRWGLNESTAYLAPLQPTGTSITACSPRGACWAVVNSISLQTDVVIGEVGGRFLRPHVEEIPHKGEPTARAFVDSISCWSAESCTLYEEAWFLNSHLRDEMFTQSERNGVWSTAQRITPTGVRLPGPIWVNPFVRGPFTCFSPTACWLGGSTSPTAPGNSSKSIVIHNTSSGWSSDFVGSPRTIPRASTVESLACASTTLCVISGGTTTPGSASQYFQVEVNGTWRGPLVEPIQDNGVGIVSEPVGTRSNDAACASSTTCYVVGTMNATNGPQIGFVAKYERARWTFEPLALQEGESETSIQGISCAQSTCWAVGYAASSNWTRGFTFRIGPA